MKNLAGRLKCAMKLANMNQTELAEKSGCSKAAISTYLSNSSNPSEERMKALAEALGVSVDYLLGNDATDGEKKVYRACDVKITFAKACRCLGKSQPAVRALLREGCEFGRAVQGEGQHLNYIFYPGKFREYVGEDRFNEVFLNDD